MIRIHCCLLDRECRKYARLYGMPLRLHVGRRFITLFANNRRSKRLWDEAEAQGNVWRRDPTTGRMINSRGETRDWPPWSTRA